MKKPDWDAPEWMKLFDGWGQPLTDEDQLRIWPELREIRKIYKES